MKKEEFTSLIEKEILNGESILNSLHSLKKLENDRVRIGPSYPKYNPEECERLVWELTMWERRVRDILKCFFSDKQAEYLEEFHISNPNIWFDFKKSAIKMMNHNLMTLRSYLQRIDFLLLASEGQNNINLRPMTLSENKPYKVFISHSSEDEKFVNELVSLLEFLGVDSSEKLLCSSIDGYRIPVSEKFADYILKQFYEYNLFVIFVHSPNYYNSAYSLNEMGASWVLKKDFFSFLVKGFEYSKMNGFIDGSYISVKVDSVGAKGRLNELKNKLIPLFKPDGVEENRWEARRDAFLEKVNALPSSQQSGAVSGKDTEADTLFSTSYLPIFEKILSHVDMSNFPYWTYTWAFSGDSKISIETYGKLDELKDFLLRIAYHKGYEQFDNPLKNLALFMSDYIKLCDEHLKLFGNEVYTIDRFYKAIPNNPDYDVQLEEYKEYSWLLCDMTLELARLLNLILERIRERKPDFYITEGIFAIRSIDRGYVTYREEEKSDFPYPGLKAFVKIRSSRSYCYSKTAELGFIQ